MEGKMLELNDVTLETIVGGVLRMPPKRTTIAA